jgi:DedD protein
MRYTSESTMDDRALADVERWKDKIEVRLDNRQVFFLFFGSALVACLLFILGVIVGKRLESRGRAVSPEIEDPLALLDKVASTPRTGPEAPPALPKMLFGASTAPAAKVIPPGHAKPTVAAAKPEPAPKPAVAAKAEPAAKAPVVAAKAEPAPKPAAAAKADPAPKPPVVVAKAEPTPKAPVVVAKAEPAPKPEPPKPAVAAVKKMAMVTPPPPSGTDAAKAKGRFTLQLGSFPDRAEAEAFSQRFTPQGSYVIASEIPGKGTWYRVRVGDYANAKDAIAAKGNFEKQHNVIAYVVGPR